MVHIIYSTSNVLQPNLEISLGASQWKEVGVVGAEALRTETEVYGDYKLGINTVARAVSTDYEDGFVSTATYPRANLDVVGNTFISGRTQTTLSDGSGGSPTATNYALLVGGASDNPDSTAEFRIATTTLAQAGRTEGPTADIDNGRVGINVNDAALDKNFVVSGDARITGDFTFQSDIDVNGGDIRSTAATFSIANQSSTTSLNLAGYAQNIAIGDLTTNTQTINIGTAATGSATLNIHTDATNSTIDIGSVNNTGASNTSQITIGGAFANKQSSILNVKNYQTIIDGILTLQGGEINTTANIDEFTIFPSGITKLNIGLSVGELTLGGVAGETQIRNGIRVQGSSFFESDITQNGGLKNTNLGIDRNIFGTIRIATLARSSNVATVTTVNPHSLTTGNTVEIDSSVDSFNTVGTVSVTVVDSNTFTYSNTGADFTIASATGTVITNVGATQSTGSLENLNIDYFSVVDDFSGIVNITTVTNNKILVDTSGHFFNTNEAIQFIDVGNLTGLSTSDTYYILSRDALGFTLKDVNDNQITIGLQSGSTDAGTARAKISETVIDTVGAQPWGDDSYKYQVLNGEQTWLMPISNPSGIGINELYLVGTEIIRTVNFPTTYVPDAPQPYTVEVTRGERGTAQSAHADGESLIRLVEQQNASYIFPNPLTALDSTINVAEFSAAIKQGDLFRLNKTDLDNGGEYVKITVINPADAQSFTINNGDFGTTVLPKDPLEVFKTITTTGNTQISGDVVIGYDTTKPFINAANDQNLADAYGKNSSEAIGAAITDTGGGNLTVHNSIELSGNTSTSLPSKQYFVITNGTLPKFYVESASGNTSIYNGGNLKVFKDSFFATGSFDKERIDAANNIALEVLGATGNTKIAGSLRTGDDFSVGTLATPANAESGSNLHTARFTVDAQTGDTYVGRYLEVNGAAAATPSAATEVVQINNMGVNGDKPFTFRQDASIEAFGQENFYNANGGRKTIFVSTQGNTDATAFQLEPNLQYLVIPSSTLVLRLPSNAITGDTIRIVDVGGALNFANNLVVRAPLNVKIQGSDTGSNLGGVSNYAGGELVVNTPNAAFGLIYAGNDDLEGNGIPDAFQGWWLMEI
jgi:hypothetical protein